MALFRIHTNWTNSVSETHEFALEDLVDAANREKLKWAMADPERLRPGETRQDITERAAATFALLAHNLRRRGHDPQAVAHFVNRLVFCMFAEDVGLLPNDMFTRMLEGARKRPEAFAELASRLFGAMSEGGDVCFESVAWSNGGLFGNDEALPLEKAEIEIALTAAALDWSEIAERLENGGAAKSSSPRRQAREQASQLLGDFLARLREFQVLDPACGSGNFLYLALQVLKDMEHRAQIEADTMGLQRGFPRVGPANVKGIEINSYAAELARVSVWIGEIQWMRRNGFVENRDPVLKPLDTIECRDAILTKEREETT